MKAVSSLRALRACRRTASAGVVQRAEDGALLVGASRRDPHGLSLLAPDLCQTCASGDGCGSRIRRHRPNGVLQRIVRPQVGFFLQPLEHPFRRCHGGRILAVPQIVPRTAGAIAQRLDHSMQRADTDPQATLPLQQRLQVAQGPCRHGQAVRLWPLLQRLFHQHARRLIQCGGTSDPGDVRPGCGPVTPDALLSQIAAARRARGPASSRGIARRSPACAHARPTTPPGRADGHAGRDRS